MKKSLLLCVLLSAVAFALQAQPYYLRGEAAPCGWSNTSAGCELTDPDGDGTFSLTIALNPASCGNSGNSGCREFKIYSLGNNTWHPAGSNAWYSQSGTNVTFNFTPATGAVNVSDPSFSICAPGQLVTPNWVNSTPMTNVTGNTWCITVPNPGTYIWKPTQCGFWNSWEQNGGNRGTNTGNWSVTTNAPNEQVCVVYDPATGRVAGTNPPPTGYYIRGSAAPCDWFGNFTPPCQLTDPDGDGTFTLTIDYGASPRGLQEFKVYHAATSTWYPSGANSWFLHRGGSVTFKFIPSTGATFAIDVNDINICNPGQYNGFNNASQMVKFQNGTWCANIPTPGTYEWKPTLCGTWSSWQPTDGERSVGSDNWSVRTTVPDQQVCVTYDPATGRVRAGSFFVPTMTQWGMFIFGLCIMIFGLVTVRQRNLVLSGVNQASLSVRDMPLNKGFMLRAMGVCFSLVIFAFSAAIYYFGYTLTSSDIPGALMSIPLVSYILQLVFGEK